jgi:hypothetical protein
MSQTITVFRTCHNCGGDGQYTHQPSVGDPYVSECSWPGCDGGQRPIGSIVLDPGMNDIMDKLNDVLDAISSVKEVADEIKTIVEE